MVIDLSKRVEAWRKENKAGGKTIKKSKDTMNNEYEKLIIRYGPNVDGSWSEEKIGDLRTAAILLARPMKELYLGLEQNKGHLRTMRYEIQIAPIKGV